MKLGQQGQSRRGIARWVDNQGQGLPLDRGQACPVCDLGGLLRQRAVGVDLQRLVHEDMTVAFAEYPALWGMRRPDPNIDHRRVPNLQTFLRRQGADLPTSQVAADYRPGDLVTWMLPGNLPHIGIVVDRRTEDGGRPLVVHNIGAGPRMEDALFAFPITGHFRYAGAPQPAEL